MIVVIQCAAGKRPDAGHLRTRDGRRVLFVADPAGAPSAPDVLHARPDDLDEDGVSWRDRLLAYNATRDHNPLGLARAVDLYENETYRELTRRFGVESTYILSAGWGLLQAEFLTPAYDITFSQAAPAYLRRRRGDAYADFRLPPLQTSSPIVFFGGRDYVPLFAALTTSARSRTVFFNAAVPPDAPECVLKRFDTATRTNWHYECARAFIAGRISVR